MRYWAGILSVIGVLLVLVGGTFAWLESHRGYPHAVYYFKTVTTDSSGAAGAAFTQEQWVDPVSEVQRWRFDTPAPVGEQLDRDGMLYAWHAGGAVVAYRTPSAQWSEQVREMRAFLDGLGGYIRLLRTELQGRLTSVQFQGRPAERLEGDGVTFWFDARMPAPLQVQQSGPDAASETIRWIRAARLAPGALPSDFFEPPLSPTQPWERLAGWLQGVRDRLGVK